MRRELSRRGSIGHSAINALVMNEKSYTLNPKEAAKPYLQPFIDGTYELSNDASWADKAQGALVAEPREVIVSFWRQLDRLYKQKETDGGTLLHKGHIYWRLGLEHLLWGKLNTGIFYFAKSAREDRRRGETMSSAIALHNILKPLKKRANAQWLYGQMTQEEREMFAVTLMQTHNQTIGHGITLIKDEYFHFIENKALRSIVLQQYHEVFTVIASVRDMPSHYICVFATGSIVEGIIDDLLVKQNHIVWKNDSFISS